MAAAAVTYAAMSADGEKDVHPFFARVNGAVLHVQDENQIPSNELPNNKSHHEPSEQAAARFTTTDSKRRKVKDGESVGSTKTQKTLNDILNPELKSSEDRPAVNAPIVNHGRGEPRQKRRRTNEPAQDVTSTQPSILTDNYSDVAAQTNSGLPQASSLAPNNRSTMLPLIQAAPGPVTPPKKMLRLKANGKFSSPVSDPAKEEQGQYGPEPTKRRTRGRKASRCLVKIAYGKGVSSRAVTSKAIDRILIGTERYIPSVQSERKGTTPQKLQATHPFFLGKTKVEPPAPAKPSPRKASAVTPGKLRLQTYGDHALDLDQPVNDSFGSGLLRDRLMVRHPGASDPPFPRKGQAHVRSIDEHEFERPMDYQKVELLYGRRKYKETRLPFPEHESVVHPRIYHANLASEPRLRPDGFRDPPSSLHVPRRRLLCGEDILQHASRQLSVSQSLPGDGIAGTVLSGNNLSSASQRLVHLVPTAMTAFDLVGGETLAWTQKYAPKTASDVLQPNKVMMVLKDWLNSLKIQTVSNGIGTELKTAAKPSSRPKKKRKKRNDDLDDFLVESDEEIHDMSEILDVENESSTEASRSVKSIVQTSHGGAKLSNAVLISGPPGCGKTAAAYAVAKELDFKIFEINSSERRSGKDVIEKVGDMAENHLVKHHGTDSADLSSTEEPSRIDEAFRRDLESGRQGRMNAFFKPQTGSKSSVPKKPKLPQVLKTVQEAIKKHQPKEQQQSLILLEEVDVLFRDDKDFWTVVLKMILDSKRPFIMTCNDEDIVPLQAINLHAILRLTQPPEDLAADYMLLIAAAEGHLLDRKAVLSLYRTKGFDFRATLVQLQFWCQMGIGDPRGGLAWIYQRWPPGSDVDEQGRKIRVVSDGTYEQTIGLTPDGHEATTETMLRWAWAEFSVEPAIALGWDELAQRIDHSREDQTADPDHRFAILKNFSSLADSLSAADTCCNLDSPDAASLDTTTPEISDKVRGQYIEGLRVLQTDEHIDHSHTNEDLLISISLLAFQISLFSNPNPTLGPEHLLPYLTGQQNTHVNRPPIPRRNFACFDAIAVPEEGTFPTGTGMVQSAFDGPLTPIALDLAPYARTIVRGDRTREERRDRIERLTSEGGRKAKRARTTRAARSALEGGQRATTRRERWFAKGLDYDAVLATGGAGEDWKGESGGGGESWAEGSRDEGVEAPSPVSATSAGGAE